MTAQPAPKKQSNLLFIIMGVIGLCLVCVLAILVLAVLGIIPTSSTITVNSPTPTPTPQIFTIPPPSPSVQPLPQISSRCVPASSQQMDAIRSGVTDIQANNNVLPGFAVHSKDFQNVWFVAAEITGPGIQSIRAIGVWAITGDPASPGMVLSVDGYATQFSSYPDGSETDAHTSLTDDGAQEALGCATNN